MPVKSQMQRNPDSPVLTPENFGSLMAPFFICYLTIDCSRLSTTNHYMNSGYARYKNNAFLLLR